MLLMNCLEIFTSYLGFSGINTVDFMEKVSEQAVSIKQGLEMVKVELDNPGRLLHSENDIKELSILKKLAGESMKNLKNLYDETKYLRAYLEKVRYYIPFYILTQSNFLGNILIKLQSIEVL